MRYHDYEAVDLTVDDLEFLEKQADIARAKWQAREQKILGVLSDPFTVHVHPFETTKEADK